MMEITLQTIQELDPCDDQLELFERWLGRRKSVPLTKKNVRSAARKGLDAGWFFEHAGLVPKNDLRTAACGDPDTALSYARFVERAPHDETRKAACEDPRTAYLYALKVDRSFHIDTYNKAIEDPLYRALYLSKQRSGLIPGPAAVKQSE